MNQVNVLKVLELFVAMRCCDVVGSISQRNGYPLEHTVTTTPTRLTAASVVTSLAD
jgi:hypothetical protein